MNIIHIIKFNISFFLIFHNEYLHHCQATPLVGNSVRLAEKNEFPFIVSISSDTRENMKSKIVHICGGSLITYSHILTAAHCFNNKFVTRWVAKVGAIDLRYALIHEISWWVMYNDWVSQDDPTVKNRDRFHDIAIAKLFKSVNSSIQLGILTKQPAVYIYGREAVTAGWGLIEKGVGPDIMRAVDFTVHYPEKCIWDVSHLGNDTFLSSSTPMFICTSTKPPARTTYGDSGSPLLLQRREIIGVNLGYCTPDGDPRMQDDMNVHAPINYYIKFIVDVARIK